MTSINAMPRTSLLELLDSGIIDQARDEMLHELWLEFLRMRPDDVDKMSRLVVKKTLLAEVVEDIKAKCKK